MKDLSLDNEMQYEITARLIGKGHDGPLTGDAYSVKLFDKDQFSDDYIGEATPDENGIAKFYCHKSDFGNFANLDEKPDFYFVVYKHKKEIFKSQVMQDLDLETIENFKMGEGEVIDLGTFLVEG